MVQVRCPECGYLQTLSEERFVTISENFLNCPHCHARVPKQWIPDADSSVPEEVQHKMLAFSRRILNGGDVGLEVVQALESLVRQFGATAESIKALGIGYANLRETKKAEEFLVLALKEAPGDPGILQALLEVFLENNKFNEAVRTGKSLLERGSGRAADQDVARLGLALIAAGDREEASRLLASFPDLDLRNPLVKQVKRKLNWGASKGFAAAFLGDRGPLSWLRKRGIRKQGDEAALPTEPVQDPQSNRGDQSIPQDMSQPNPEQDRKSDGPASAVMEYWIYAPETSVPSWEEVKATLSRSCGTKEDLHRTREFLEAAIDNNELALEYILRDEALELFQYPEEQIPRNGRELTEDDRAILLNAHTIVRLRLAKRDLPSMEALFFMGRLVEAVRSLTGGVVQDAVSHVLWGTEQWQSVVEGSPRWGVDSHVKIEMLDEGGLVWIHTHGMAKFGLPDLEIEGIPSDEVSAGRDLVSGAAHTLIASLGPDFELRPELAIPNTPLMIQLVARPRDEEGHFPFGSLLLVPYLSGSDPKAVDALQKALRALKSASCDTETGAKAQMNAPKTEQRAAAVEQRKDTAPREERAREDYLRAQLLAAHRRAREDLDQLKSSFLGDASRSHIHAVKVGFPAQEGQFEWMWVSLDVWRGNALVGRLENSPVLRKDLRKGCRVQISVGQIFDWVISREGKLVKGPYTEHILRPGQ